jgi:hypothetical protein
LGSGPTSSSTVTCFPGRSRRQIKAVFDIRDRYAEGRFALGREKDISTGAGIGGTSRPPVDYKEADLVAFGEAPDVQTVCKSVKCRRAMVGV